MRSVERRGLQGSVGHAGLRGRVLGRSPAGLAPPLSVRPERFRRETRLAPSAHPGAKKEWRVTFQRPCVLAVRLPERFRGGCAFGSGSTLD
jgi:hypothetical protein